MNKVLLTTALLAGMSGVAGATVYSDSVGDVAAAIGSPNLDIMQMEVTDDGTNITFDIQVNGDLDGSNWGKYALGINNGSGSVDAGNPWGRNIDWGLGQQISHWVATWADDGGTGIGGQVWSYAAGWSETSSLFSSDDSQHAAGRQIFTVALADLGLSAGDTFTFDLITTGNGADPGVDHLSVAGEATPGWGDTSVGGQFLSYTVTPTPGSMALLGLGGLVATRRRR